MANHKTKVGLIGCGKQAPKHISGLRQSPELEIVVADVNADAAHSLAEKENVQVVNHPDDLFADPSIQAVDICTPTPFHVPLALQALESGKDFFCEKPLCETRDSAEELQLNLEKSQQFGMVGYVYRFSPLFEQVKNILGPVENPECPELGKINWAMFRIGGRGSHQVWKHRKETGGGAINEMLVHMIDLALWYFGPMESIAVHSKHLISPQRTFQGKVHEVDAEDFVLVEGKTVSGVHVICQADMLTPAFTQFVEIQGEHGSFSGSIQPDVPAYLYTQNETDSFSAGKNRLAVEPCNLYERQMGEFLRIVSTRSEVPRSTVSDSLLLLDTMQHIK